MGLIINFLVTAVATYLLSRILNGVQVEDFQAALLFSLILGIIGFVMKPLLTILTIPITILTLGLFLLVINAIVILTAAYFVDGIHIDNFWWAILFSVLLSILTSVLDNIVAKII